MPTQAEFLQAAQMLRGAATEVGDLTAAAVAADVGSILFGGALGRQVPDRIAEAAAVAASCQADIEAAAELCEERAAIIGDYLTELNVYDARYSSYLTSLSYWQRAYDDWYHGGGELAYPGYPPTPPTPPVAPPAWADVRRV